MNESDEIEPFEPRQGLIMKEYVQVPENKLNDRSFIDKWIRASYEYVSSLPPKEKKTKRKSTH